MNPFNISISQPVKIKPYVWGLVLAWSFLVAVSLTWNISEIRDASLKLAIIQARESFNKDVLYRRWNAMHGGVYVPVTGETEPNSYLEVPNRDIAIGDDRVLTLINPAYMTRQVYELMSSQAGISGHITSLDPIRPENAPDAWEATALETFEKGVQEVSSIEMVAAEEHLRLMRPVTSPARRNSASGSRIGRSMSWRRCS